MAAAAAAGVQLLLQLLQLLLQAAVRVDDVMRGRRGRGWREDAELGEVAPVLLENRKEWHVSRC